MAEGLRITQIAYFLNFVVFCLKGARSGAVGSLYGEYGETVEVAVAVAVVAVAVVESVISRVVLGVVLSGGVVGEVRSVRSGNVADTEGPLGKVNTNARAAPATNGTTTATQISRSTKVVYLRPGGDSSGTPPAGSSSWRSLSDSF